MATSTASAATTLSATASAAATLLDLGGLVAGAVFFNERLTVPLLSGIAGDGLLDYFFNIPEEIDLVIRTERNGESGGSGTTSAADAVDVCFRLVGKIVVHDETHVFHIHATCSDVGSNKDRDDSLFEFG